MKLNPEAINDLYEACDTALMFLMDFDDKQVALIVDKLKRAMKKARKVEA